jgi:hypothetical protein
MAIITLAEVKARLRISANTYDTYITAIIPDIQDFVMAFCNNRFHVTNVYIYSSTIAFVNGSPATITDGNENFLNAYFADGMTIDVEESLNNDGVYLLDTVAAGTLTLDSNETLIDEAAGLACPRITRVKFPTGIKLPVSSLIKYLLQSMSLDNDDKDVKSIRLSTHSETYSGGFDSSYFPEYLLKQFTPYKRIGMV